MFFLNFGLMEFFILAGAASLATVALYLLDRSRRRLVVSTLRFWTSAPRPVQTQRRRRLQQPWSLLLQLLGILLLLLAMAQPRWGNLLARPGHHVLVLDTSAWMAARSGNATLMDTARTRALKWLASIPPGDPVMLVRADALATPATPFEPDHRRVANAITASEPGSTALNLASALEFAHRVQNSQGVHGEIAFVGAGRIKNLTDAPAEDTRNVRVLLIADQMETAGLRGLSARRSATDPEQWTALVSVRNYGVRSRAVDLILGFNQAPVGVKHLVLAPGVDQDAGFSFRSVAGGIVDARLLPGDAFPADDHAALTIPANPVFPVIVYSTRAEVLRPFLLANPRVQAQFRSLAQYQASDHGLVILDRFSPPTRPDGDAVWIDPPRGQSPIPIVDTIHAAGQVHWMPNSPLAAGLHAQDVRLPEASIFQPAAGDDTVGSVRQGPVVVARTSRPRMVVLGFDPGNSAVRFELSTPLIFANILSWMNPESFTASDVNVQPAGFVSAPLTGDSGSLHLTREDGTPVPFTSDGHSVHFFLASSETVRLQGDGRNSAYALTLPEMWDRKWKAPADSLNGIGPAQGVVKPQKELWPWLAVLGALCLLADWILLSGPRRARESPTAIRAPLRRAS